MLRLARQTSIFHCNTLRPCHSACYLCFDTVTIQRADCRTVLQLTDISASFEPTVWPCGTRGREGESL